MSKLLLNRGGCCQLIFDIIHLIQGGFKQPVRHFVEIYLCHFTFSDKYVFLTCRAITFPAEVLGGERCPCSRTASASGQHPFLVQDQDNPCWNEDIFLLGDRADTASPKNIELQMQIPSQTAFLCRTFHLLHNSRCLSL